MSSSHPAPRGSDRPKRDPDPLPESPSAVPPQLEALRGYGKNAAMLGHGLTLAATLGLFAYGGLWLDARFGTRPWLLLVCVACGLAGGILHLIRVLAPDLWPFAPATKTRQGPPPGG